MRNNDYVFACVLSLMPRFFSSLLPGTTSRHAYRVRSRRSTADPSAGRHQSRPAGAFAARSARGCAQDTKPTGDNIEQDTSNGAAFKALSGCKSRQTAICATICRKYWLQKTMPGGPRCTSRCQFSLPHPLRGSGANVECRIQNSRTRRSPSIFQTRCRW